MRAGNSVSNWWYTESPQIVFTDSVLSMTAYPFDDNWAVESINLLFRGSTSNP